MIFILSQPSPKNSVWLHEVVGDMVEGTYYINAESKAPISSVEARGPSRRIFNGACWVRKIGLLGWSNVGDLGLLCG